MFPLATLNNKYIITTLILLFAFRRVYSLRTNKDTKQKLFDSAFWIGIATLFYPWCFVYIFLIYGGIFLFNKSTIRNILIPIIGFVTPIFIFGIYSLLVNNLSIFNTSLNYSFLFSPYNEIKLLIPITLLVGFIIWTIFPTTSKISSINNEFKTSWFLILAHLAISLILVTTAQNKNGSEFIFLFFPIAIVFTNYLQIIKERWFKEVFLYFFITAILFIELL
jgi:hypothetical protein